MYLPRRPTAAARSHHRRWSDSLSVGCGTTATVLLTGAGGAAIPTLIQHLKGLGHRVLTCDMNPQAPGLFLGDGGFVVPPATEPGFERAMEGLCQHEGVDVIIPLVDEELLRVKSLFSMDTFLVPKAKFIHTCLDKYELMRTLGLTGIPTPKTIGQHMVAVQAPAILKPRRGRGSRGIEMITTKEDLLALMQREGVFNTNVLQEYIEGPEYTVSVVCDRRNVVHAVVPKEIILKQSSTRLAVTRRNDKIDTLCRRIAEAMNPCGPFNVQLRLRDGEPYVFEINPRFSGTVNLTIAAGCDEVGGLIELALGRPYTFGEWREGVVLVRQTHDGIMTEEDFNQRTPRSWDS